MGRIKLEGGREGSVMFKMERKKSSAVCIDRKSRMVSRNRMKKYRDSFRQTNKPHW